jgi:phosphatidylglycerophosphate synthase
VEFWGLERLRPTRAGLFGGTALLVLMGAWLEVARPPGVPWALAWFVLLALAGLLLPGLANQLSLVRAYLAAPAVVYAVTPSGLGGLAAVVALAGCSDLLDGMAARRLDRPTRLGGALDPLVDGVFFGAAAIGLAAGGAYPPWLAGVVVVRYAVPAVAGAILFLAQRPVTLRHTPLGQVSTTVIAVVLGGIALLRGIGVADDWLVEVGIVLVPLSTLATWANLFWANRDAIASGRAGSG